MAPCSRSTRCSDPVSSACSAACWRDANAAAVPAAWPMAMHVPVMRALARALRSALMQRPATTRPSMPEGSSARNGMS
jgi:hypothetical protein